MTRLSDANLRKLLKYATAPVPRVRCTMSEHNDPQSILERNAIDLAAEVLAARKVARAAHLYIAAGAGKLDCSAVTESLLDALVAFAERRTSAAKPVTQKQVREALAKGAADMARATTRRRAVKRTDSKARGG